MVGTYVHLGFSKTLVECIDYEEVLVQNAVKVLDPVKVAACDFVFIRIVGGPLRVTPHAAGTPSTIFGFILNDSESTTLGRIEATTLKAISGDGLNVTIQAAYYKNV